MRGKLKLEAEVWSEATTIRIPQTRDAGLLGPQEFLREFSEEQLFLSFETPEHPAYSYILIYDDGKIFGLPKHVHSWKGTFLKRVKVDEELFQLALRVLSAQNEIEGKMDLFRQAIKRRKLN